MVGRLAEDPLCVCTAQGPGKQKQTDPPTPVLLKERSPSQCCPLELLVMMNARHLGGWEMACVSRKMGFNFNLSSDEFVTTDTWSPY